MKSIMLPLLVGALISVFVSAQLLPAATEEECNELITSYSKFEIIRNILKVRNSFITVEVNGVLHSSSGLPQEKFITPRSVCADLEAAGISVSQFKKILAQWRQEADQRAIEQRQRREEEEKQKERAQQQAKAERRHAAILENGPERETCRDSVTAYAMAQYFIKQGLKSPYSAVFAPLSETQTHYHGGCRHTIASYVDAQNGFGAMLRTRYEATVRYKGNGTWVLEKGRFLR